MKAVEWGTDELDAKQSLFRCPIKLSKSMQRMQENLFSDGENLIKMPPSAGDT